MVIVNLIQKLRLTKLAKKMTKIQIFKKNENIVGFEISGHTGKGVYSSDVLCAGISAVSQSTLLGIIKVLKIKTNIEKNEDKGYLKLDMTQNSAEEIEKSQVLLRTMVESIQDISIGNEKYMKVEVCDEIH